MHAVILAGGRGVRLRPYTTLLPKPLVPLGDEMAVVELVLRQLAAAGCSGATLAVGHLGQLIRAYCGDGSQWGLALDYWDEETPLGTMGPLVAHRDELPDHVLVVNGDVLTDLDYAALLDGHVAAGADLSVTTYEREQVVDFGVLQPSADGTSIVAFEEKPVHRLTVSMGIYAVSRSVLADYAPGTPLGFDELVIDRLAADRPPRAVPFAGFWLDIGRPEDYDRANREWPTLRSRLLPG